MKSDSLMPLCVNVMRLKSYLLKPDELIFFDWLIIKQTSFKEESFYYSYERIYEETRISRRRLDAIIKHFKEMGFLCSEAKGSYMAKGKVTFFKVNFNNLLNCLDNIINSEHSEYYTSFYQFIKKLSNGEFTQKRGDNWKERGKEYFKKIEEIYNSRIELYNKNHPNARKKLKTGFSKSDIRYRKLYDINDIQGETSVRNAFIAFADAVISGKEEDVRHPLELFLTKSDNGEYPVFTKYLDCFNVEYSVS